MLKKLKTSGHWLFENGYPALFWAGLTVGVNLLLFEEFFEENSCEKTASYGSDAAKILFWTVFITRLILLPISAKILVNIVPSYKLPKRTTVTRIEDQFNDGIETALFVFETAKAANMPTVITYIISIPAIWPIFCSVYKFFQPSFIRGPMKDYAHFKPATKRRFCTSFEALYNLLSLGSATSFLVSLLFNFLYNTTHPKPYSHQQTIFLTLIGISCTVGGFSIAGNKIYRVMNYSEVFINSLYYFLNITISSVACLDPAAFTDQGFVHVGWKYVLVVGLLSLVVAFIGGFHGLENPYVEHKHHQKHESPKEAWFSFLRSKEKAKPDININGLSNESLYGRFNFEMYT